MNFSMEFKYLSINEKKLIYDLYTEAFDDTDSYVKYYVYEFSKNTDTFVCIENDKVISMANVHYKCINVAGHMVEATYIYGVATLKRYRNQGIMKKLMSMLIKDLKQKSDLIYLIPAVSPQYYESLGFKLVRNGKKYHFYNESKGDTSFVLEKNFITKEQMRKYIKELLEHTNVGYIEYEVLPIMVLKSSSYMFPLSIQEIDNDEAEDINIDELHSLEDIYGDILNNEYA